MKHVALSLCIFSAGIIFFSGCKINDASQQPAPVSSKISAGANVPLISQTTSGGRVTYTKSGDSLSGLSLTIPNSSYSSARTYTIGYRVITGSKLDSDTHILSPIITITNGSGYSDSIMTMKIPIHLPPGDFPMAFAYNGSTGELEAIPFFGYDNNSITIWTKHFQYFSDFTTSTHSKGAHIDDNPASANIVVLSKYQQKLLKTDQTTFFKPGVDDWGFPNYGCTLAPNGQCQGMSLSVMWYWYTQKLGKSQPALWMHYDNNGLFPTPNIWQDDANGYKFTAVMQNDGFGPYLTDILSYLAQPLPPTDFQTFLAYKMAIDETSKPQYVTVRASENSAHALVVYSVTGSDLNVCDPNFPGHTDRKITLSGNSFLPYNGSESVLDPPHLYPKIIFLAASSDLDWTTANKHWNEFNRGVIGDGLFPSFIVNVQDDPSQDFVPMTDGFDSKTGSPAFRLDYGAQKPLMISKIFIPNGDTLVKNAGRWNIPGGADKLGFYVIDQDSNWAGFKWFDIKPVAAANTIFPLKVGNIWIYRNSSLDTNGNTISSHPDTMKILTGSLWQPGDSIFGVFPSGRWPTNLIPRTNGIFQPSGNSVYQYLKYPAAVNDTFGTFNVTTTLTEDKTLSFIGGVTEPAGSYTAYWYETEFRKKSDGSLLSPGDVWYTGLTDWARYVEKFVPGVGKVEEEYYSLTDSGRPYVSVIVELVEYHLK